MTTVPRTRVAIVGPGRLGTVVALGLRQAGYRIAAIAGGSAHSRQRLADMLGGTHTYATIGESLAGVDLVVLAVSDRALQPVVRALAADDAFTPAHTVVHLSGAYGVEVLRLAELAGATTAACHPAVSVPQIVTDPARITNAAWAVTASPASLPHATRFVEDLSGTAYPVAEDRRVLYHAALTLASNATAAAVVTARRLLQAAGVDAPEPFLQPLATASVTNAVRDGVAGMSGPVMRGDVDTLTRHHDALVADVAPCAPAYDAFTRGIVHTVVAANPAVDAELLLNHIGEPPLADTMTVIDTAAQLRAVVHAEKQCGRTVVLVPTMGALHAGHLALVRDAKRHGDVVLVSIFVNPTQFDNQDDLAAYPRTFEADLAALNALGDAAPTYVFAPSLAEVYPGGTPRTTVTVSGLTDTLCGAHRPGHFAGVATVVTKLLLLTGCDVAVFGQKDFQQTAVIRQLVADLNIPASIVVLPTVRETDGLALSSRNVRLDDAGRQTARALSRSLAAAVLHRRATRGPVDVAACVAKADAVLADSQVRLEYLTAVDPVTLQPIVGAVERALLAVAGHVEDVRLIDNVLLGDVADEQRLIDAVFATGETEH